MRDSWRKKGSPLSAATNGRCEGTRVQAEGKVETAIHDLEKETDKEGGRGCIILMVL